MVARTEPGREPVVDAPGSRGTRLPQGLSADEVAKRAAAGKLNVDTSQRRRDRDVILENALTFFNLVLATLIVSLVAVGETRDGLFVGVVVIANTLVATLQEIRATHQLQSLVALTAPQATVRRDGKEETLPATGVVEGDVIRLQRGDQVVADGKILVGPIEIDESLLTGESDPIERRKGEEILSGSFCVSGGGYYEAIRVGLESYSLKLVSDARQLVRRSSPLQLRFKRLLRVLLHATAVLAALLMISYNVQDRGLAEALQATTATVTTIVPEGLLLALTVAFVIGAARVSRRGAIVQDISAIEALNYVDVLSFDKTGTITANRLELESIYWADETAEANLPWLAAMAEEAREDSGTAGSIAAALEGRSNGAAVRDRVAFSSERRWSAAELGKGDERRVLVLGAPEVLLADVEGGADLLELAEQAAAYGLRTAALAEVSELSHERDLRDPRPLALITLRDVLRPEFRNTIQRVEELGIEMKVISGDRPDTVAALLNQLGIQPRGGLISGLDLEKMSPAQFVEAVERTSVFGRIAPNQKSEIVRALQARGHFVAMVGDGANDVHALRAADVAVSMASGTSTARAVSGVVLLNDSFQAFIAATQEARAVLGNAARLSKLFITKSLYAYLIIVATSLLGLDFPFLPRHGSLTSLLTLGIPAVFIAMGDPPQNSGKDFTHTVLRFALPASLALAAAAIVVHLLTEGAMRRGIDEARTMVAITIAVTALVYVVEILGFEGASWRQPVRPVLTLVLTAGLIMMLFATLYIPVLRSFFEFVQPDVADWVLIGVAVTGALVCQYLFSRYWQRILDFLAAKPKPTEELRGRPV